MAEQSRRRVVLFPCPFQGHINPMLQLATILHTHSKGSLSIIIVHTEFNSPKASNYPDFTFLPILDGLSQSQSKVSVSDLVSFLPFLNEICVSPFTDCLVNKILSEDHKPRVACIISDSLMYFTQSVADSLQLPVITLRTSSATTLAVFAAYPLLREKGHLPIKDYLFVESEREQKIPEFSPLKVKDIPVIKNADMDLLFDFIGNMVNGTKASSGLILNSCGSLEQLELVRLRKEFPSPHFAIGPFHKCVPMTSSSLLVEDQSCISWLNKQAPASVIYISFGSLASVDEAQLVEIALGIANSEQSFLWVLRPQLVIRSDKDAGIHTDLSMLLPQKFNDMMEMHPGRGCIVKWAPQQEVLENPAVGCFWTHNGWNSTLESVCEGVPMLCWPCFGDQMVNARYVAEVWRVGFMLENGLEHGEIERYIKRLMVKEDNKERYEMMIRVKNLKEKTNLCLRNDGSSVKALENLRDFIFSI